MGRGLPGFLLPMRYLGFIASGPTVADTLQVIDKIRELGGPDTIRTCYLRPMRDRAWAASSSAAEDGWRS